MKDVNHTNPYTGETFGAAFQRGPAVADGGAVDDRADARSGEAMRDVDHTPLNGESANRVWARGANEAEEADVRDRSAVDE
ncbi:hypothetical protein [Halegenticoccus tardaugens]|uniref:hypothetical protein n=1 Tax=Halegenticoccus tardaugens TaxID=2071624 RepID=UPI00100AD579|nr:hypothetical protein [Halegenticoccus tardaugens]